MPIVDYELKARQSEDNLFNREDISEKNKEYLRSFFKRYEVSPARRNLFCKHIGFVLSKVDDVKKLFSDREKTNSIFEKLRNELSPAYYTTVLNVSLAFVRWLNHAQKPMGFEDIKNKGKKTQKRDLKPQDMITWQEGLKAIELSNSVQLKAIFMTQLDGGLRPSEFVDLNYGDIQKEGKYLIAQVKGKTGERSVILWRSIPYLQRWLQMHPDKKANSPLWIMEDVRKSHKKTGKAQSRYDYFAIQKRVRDLGYRAELKKPLDFYNLRHSSAVLKKLDNWPLDLAAKNMGHSVEYFDEVYGRLSLKDKTDRISKIYGLSKDKDEERNNPIECNVCGTTNEPGKTHCEKCNSPLSLTVALQEEKDKNSKIDALQVQVAKLLAKFETLENIEAAIRIKEARK